MNKKVFIIISLIVASALSIMFVLFWFFKPCEHQWTAATCVTPQKCSLCGLIEGEKLNHQWEDANCENPVTCKTCGETAGNPIGHNWKDANCTEPKTCSICNKTEGEAVGHNWKNATYSSPKTCLVCGKTDGSALTNPNNNSNNKPTTNNTNTNVSDAENINTSNNNETLTEKDLVGTWNCTNQSSIVTIFYDNNTATIIQQVDKINTSAGSDNNGDFVYTETKYKQKETRNYIYTLEGKYINLKLTSSTIQTIGGTEVITKTITATGEKTTETKEIKEGEPSNNFENAPKELIFSYDIINNSLYLGGNLKFTKVK